jgi:hypothetical protein
MAFPFLALIPAVFNTVASLGQSWLKKKEIESQGKVDIAKAKVEGSIMLAKTQMEGDQAYDQRVAEDMGTSWKDEWFTIVLSIPAVLCFVNEEWANHVRMGFKALQETPEWYQWCFIGAIIASFGLKSLVRPMLAKWFGVKNGNGNGNNGNGNGKAPAKPEPVVQPKPEMSGN